ncbi:winged helix-turn-helix domain-containing protein [Jejudonia soesokkakensis]|uniref:Winged helix-turn-helix domain-containing protein n=1 Tax=Jejudonia soesokkakensis TaxID=1323432 RepID=A0ABW2MTP4_9FLAO
MSKECKRSVNGCEKSPNCQLFVGMFQKKKYYYFLVLFGIIFSLCTACGKNKEKEEFSQRVKVALRSVGNDVLLSQEDSTSLVMPVLKTSENTYELSFEKPLSFDPGNLNASVATNFEKAGLPKNYLVEVIQCNDKEIGYSFEMQYDVRNSLVPCGGRLLPERCYTIEVKFTALRQDASENTMFFYVLVFMVIAFLVFVFYSRYYAYKHSDERTVATALGSFRFYPEQHKLVIEAQEIPLSSKECELLTILSAKTNQVVTREELTKKIWEDNGVVVGRSLDTYISKLRKKLQKDSTIKLTNVHGVGYKLEIL